MKSVEYIRSHSVLPPRPAAMAAIDVTRAEFEALQRKVQEIEENTVSIGEQFEKFQEVHTEVESKVAMHDDYNLEYTEKIRQLEGMNLESKFHDVAIAIRKFDAMNIEETFKHMADAVTRVQVQVTNDKAEFERLELKDVGGKIEELRRQAKPQPTEATAALMRELEEKVFASTVKSLGKLKGEFDVVKLQVTENIGLNDEKFKKIDEQMTKGANDRKGRIVDRKTFHSSMSKFSGSEGEPEIRGFAFQLRQLFFSKDDHYLDDGVARGDRRIVHVGPRDGEEEGDGGHLAVRRDGPAVLPDLGGDRRAEEYGCAETDGGGEALGRTSGHDGLS